MVEFLDTDCRDRVCSSIDVWFPLLYLLEQLAAAKLKTLDTNVQKQVCNFSGSSSDE